MFVVAWIQSLFRSIRRHRKVWRWKLEGRPVPPPHLIKQRALSDYGQRFGCQTFVETGTYMGEMVDAMRNRFDHIYTIELSPERYAEACERFAGVGHITLIEGDSGQQLAELVPQLTEPALFWLDGHWSAGETAKGDKETPIVEELGHILQAEVQGHVLLIDDAREFGTSPDYPTLDELRQLVEQLNPQYTMSVESDIIRLVPHRAARSSARAA